MLYVKSIAADGYTNADSGKFAQSDAFKYSESGAAEEKTVSLTFSSMGYSNQQAISTITDGDITITFAKGSNSNAPKYYTSGTAIRAYYDNTFTVNVASGKTISKITLKFGSSDGKNTITTDVGTFSSPSWTGSANSVKFTIGKAGTQTSGNRRLAGIEITYK